jgi:hypothetical protein
MIISKARFNGFRVEGFSPCQRIQSTLKRADHQSRAGPSAKKRWAINPSGKPSEDH